MLINLRNALMAGKRLPYDNEVEWLYNSGLTQYINTGIVPTANTEVSLTFDVVERPTSTKIFGGTDIPNNADAAYVILRHDSSQAADTYSFRVNHNDAINVSLPVGTHTVTMNEYGTRSLIVDGNNAGTFTGALAVNLPMYLFCRNSNGTAQTQYSMPIKLRALQIRDANGVLVRDFIPVRKGTTGYLYDRVTGKLFGNAGTGDFVLGSDVVPVEYIESHGTEYIDTGLNSTTDAFCDFEIKFRKTSTSTSTQTGGYCAPYGYRYGTVFRYGIFGGTTSSITNFWAGVDVSASVPMEKDTLWHTVKVVNGGYVDVDGVRTAIGTGSVRANIGLLLFATVSSSSGASSYIVVPSQISYCKIYNTSGVLVRDYKAIRVGTEGAMMDVLTRRIYRNAGTGAFTYGNDLKYPIPAS